MSCPSLELRYSPGKAGGGHSGFTEIKLLLGGMEAQNRN